MPAQNFAGRVGQWSANHWKTAVLAWLVFVVGAVMVGSMIGTKQIDQNEANVGESRNGDRILREAGFTVDKNGESVEAQMQMRAHPVRRPSARRARHSAPRSPIRRRRCAPSRRCTACTPRSRPATPS